MGRLNCPYAKDYAQYIDLDSLGISFDRGWLNTRQISGTGSRLESEEPQCIGKNGQDVTCFEPLGGDNTLFWDKPRGESILQQDLFSSRQDGFSYVLWSVEGDIPQHALEQVAYLTSLPSWIAKLLLIVGRFFDPDAGQSSYFSVDEQDGVRKITAPLAVHPSAISRYERGEDIVGVYIQNQECKNRFFLYSNSRELLDRSDDDSCLVTINKSTLFGATISSKSINQTLVSALELNKIDTNVEADYISVNPSGYYAISPCAIDIRQDLWQDYVYGASNEFPDLSDALNSPRFNCSLNVGLLEQFTKFLHQNEINREIRLQKRINISREILLATANLVTAAPSLLRHSGQHGILRLIQTGTTLADEFLSLYYIADSVVTLQECFKTYNSRRVLIKDQGRDDYWEELGSVSGQHGITPPLKANPLDALNIQGENSAASILARCVASTSMAVVFNAVQLKKETGDLSPEIRAWQRDLSHLSRQYGIYLDDGSLIQSLEDLNEAFTQALRTSL